MIAYLKGKVFLVTLESVLIETLSGVGYEVFFLKRSLTHLEKGQEIEVFVYTLVREDALDLYGFLSWEERKTFALLLSIPKVGPKLALAILDMFTPEELADLVVKEEVSLLANVPGIGLKSAKKIFLDLKDKLKLKEEEISITLTKDNSSTLIQDALEGLKSLGYRKEEVLPLIKELVSVEKDWDVSLLIREVLKNKARQQ